MRTYEAFILGGITGAAIVWFWRRELEDYARDKTRGCAHGRRRVSRRSRTARGRCSTVGGTPCGTPRTSC